MVEKTNKANAQPTTDDGVPSRSGPEGVPQVPVLASENDPASIEAVASFAEEAVEEVERWIDQYGDNLDSARDIGRLRNALRAAEKIDGRPVVEENLDQKDAEEIAEAPVKRVNPTRKTFDGDPVELVYSLIGQGVDRERVETLLSVSAKSLREEINQNDNVDGEYDGVSEYTTQHYQRE